jgi:hypothetical protein
VDLGRSILKWPRIGKEGNVHSFSSGGARLIRLRAPEVTGGSAAAIVISSWVRFVLYPGTFYYKRPAADHGRFHVLIVEIARQKALLVYFISTQSEAEQCGGTTRPTIRQERAQESA